MIPEKIYCVICSSTYIETTQKDVQYCCGMCRDNLANQIRDLPDPETIEWDKVTDCGND